MSEATVKEVRYSNTVKIPRDITRIVMTDCNWMSLAGDHEDRSMLKTADKRHGKTEGIMFLAAN